MDNCRDDDVKKVVDGFCDIILTQKDYINNELADDYIDSLESITWDLKIKRSEKNQIIKPRVLNNLMNYIKKYHTTGVNETPAPPFAFAGGSNFVEYRKYFNEKYKEKKGVNSPSVFDFMFNYIQDVSEHYRIFLGFYDTRSEETAAMILSKTTEMAQGIVNASASKAAGIAAQEATVTATKLAEDAQKSAETAMENAKIAAKRAADEEITKMTMKLSENSVTILGIFAGIVLTVVAGLFYSSSVIESLSSANFYRLVAISALVGLVCINLVAVMFKFIERIRNADASLCIFDNATKSVNTILLIVIGIFTFLQFVMPELMVHI